MKNEMQFRLEQLYEFCLIEKHRLGTYNERLLDIAYKAVHSEELNFVIENTTSMKVQDYALLKLVFFTSKGV